MEIGDFHEQNAANTVAYADVEFSRQDPGPVGFFNVDKLIEALKMYERNTGKDDIYLRLGIASYEHKKGFDTILSLTETIDADEGVVVAPSTKSYEEDYLTESNASKYPVTD